MRDVVHSATVPKTRLGGRESRIGGNRGQSGVSKAHADHRSCVVSSLDSGSDPLGLVAGIRRSVAEIVRISRCRTSEPDEILSRETSAHRIGVWLMGGFATLSLLLAGVGVYGVLSYMVSRRLPELALCMRCTREIRPGRCWLLPMLSDA